MKIKKRLINSLKKRILVLDGATGTQLQKYGMPAGACPEIWCIENPSVVKRVHTEYAQAGADIIYTSTFGANRFKLGEYNRNDIRAINKRLASLARESVGKTVIVAGDIGPTGHFIAPFGNLDFEEAVAAFKEQIRGLSEGGADIFVIETMMDIQEARAALIAVKEMTDAFVMVTMTFEKSGTTLNGTDPLSALVTLQSLGADAVGCNCSTGPKDMIKFITAMKPYAKIPLVAKPNAGTPKLIEGKTIFNMNAKEFSSYAGKFIAAGANMIGGCCGTNPEYISELKKAIGAKAPILAKRLAISALSSATKTVLIEHKKPLLLVGERINPTGKKELQAELLESKFSLFRQIVKEQEQEGADLLDINIGAPGADEAKIIKKAINIIPTITGLPLVIDSSNINTIESALRLYPGRLLINSISGEKKKLRKLLPLAAKYGAMFILLPVTDRQIPRTFKERKPIIRRLYREAQKYGFTKDDIIIDAITMSVSSLENAAVETLNSIGWCVNVLKANTIVGLSNVSYGLPQRKWLNAAFLAMAQAQGLTMAILNTSGDEVRNIKLASDVLTQKDKNAALFIAAHAKSKIKEYQNVSKGKYLDMRGQISQAVIEGNKEDIVLLVRKAEQSGADVLKLIDEVFIPAITRVGALFEKKEYFLPQLIASAETVKKAFDYLSPHLKKNKLAARGKAVVILSTVKSDIHDIGKNIVSLILQNHGFRVIDLGKDVSAARIVNAAKLYHADIIGLSALMTTTMVNMKEVIELAQKEGVKSKFIVGGAVVTSQFADSLGAAYGKNGVEAARIVEKLIH